jgi:hypothetical protein
MIPMLLTNAWLKSHAGAALACAVSAVLAIAWTAPALYSQNLPAPASVVSFGMIGLAESQTLRLSINAWPPNPVFAPEACIAQLAFANSSGGAVGPTKSVNLSPGQGDFLDLPGRTLWPPDPVYPPTPIRVEVLPVVTLLQSPGGGPSACLANAEILDSFSGFSLVLAPPAWRS